MSTQLEMLPDMPYERVEKRKRPKGHRRGWFYVNDATGGLMLSCDPFTGEYLYVPYDLACPRIMLFNSRSVAQRWADKLDGVVYQYPYNLDHFYSR